MPDRSDGDIRRRYGLDPDAQIRRVASDGTQPVRLTPDSLTEVTLTSELDAAAWDRPVVVAGTTGRLSVQGASVG